MSDRPVIDVLTEAIDLRHIQLDIADSYHRGDQPLAFLSPIQRRVLGNRLDTVSANYCRLATDLLAERLVVEGFTQQGQALPEVWTDWQRSGMELGHRIAILEALVLGQSFLTVWVDDLGAPMISTDTPREVAVEHDPLTHQITRAVKRWRSADDASHAVMFEPDQLTVFRGPDVPERGALPSTHWTQVDTIANPLGVVPVCELRNSGRLHERHGVPESRQIWALVDALSKLLSDVLVASESASLPRRWATGLAIQEDDDGNAVNPFDPSPGSVWTAEDPAVHFGQFDEPAMAGYDVLITMLIRQIGAIAGLPDHLIGIAGVDPSSAEQIRAAEASLVSRAYSRQIVFGPALSRVGALCQALRTGGAVPIDVEVAWRSPESRTRAAEADAATKLYQAGVLPLEATWAELGYGPAEIDQLRQQNVRSMIDKMPLTVPTGGGLNGQRSA
jgi:hypothetical protein